MPFQTIQIERRGAAEWVTLNRPERLNAVDKTMREELHRYLDQVAEDTAVRVVVLRGAGRAFCSGLDLGPDLNVEQAPSSEQAHRQLAWQRRWSQLTIKLRRMPQVVVALVNGHAAGLGFSLALAADIRIAADTAVFSAAFITIGFSGGDCGSSYHLPRVVGSSVARELLMTGRRCGADRALRVGLVSEVVPVSDLDRAGEAMVADLLATGPTGLRVTKDLVNASEAGAGLEDIIAMEDRNQMYCLQSGDPAEGIRAFAEKRRPRFGQGA